jgi:hypothetical protein
MPPPHPMATHYSSKPQISFNASVLSMGGMDKLVCPCMEGKIYLFERGLVLEDERTNL